MRIHEMAVERDYGRSLSRVKTNRDYNENAENPL